MIRTPCSVLDIVGVAAQKYNCAIPHGLQALILPAWRRRP